ncbi:MAG: hypothetical protein WCQ50_19285 [Spirochaetota bacterium]
MRNRSLSFLSMLIVLSLAALAPIAAQDAPPPLAARVADIIDSRCGSCHVWATSIAGIAGRVIPGDPGASPLMMMIDSGRMPQGGPELPPEESSAIREWILSGADGSSAEIPGNALSDAKARVGLPSFGGVTTHMTSGFLASGFLFAAAAVGTWHLVDLIAAGHAYREQIHFSEDNATPAQIALQQAEIAKLWADPKQQNLRWVHAGLLATGGAFYAYNAATGIGMLTPQSESTGKNDLHRWAFFTHLGLMTTEAVLGFVTSDALKRGDHNLVSALTPVHALAGVAAPLAILGSGLLYTIPLK